MSASRRLVLVTSVVAAAALVGIWLAASGPLGVAGQPRAAAQAAGLAIDADPTNGNRPCDPVDAEAWLEIGGAHDVAICLVNNPGEGSEVNSFQLEVSYNGELNTGDDPTCSGPCVDDNPDANDCEAQGGDASTCIGTGWNCTPFGETVRMGPPAFILCDGVVTVVATTTLTANPGLLATIHFNVPSGVGDDTLSFTTNSNIYGEACPDVGGGCTGATLHKFEGTATPTPEVTPTATPTDTPESTPVPRTPAVPPQTPPPPPPPPPATPAPEATTAPTGIVPPPTGTGTGGGGSPWLWIGLGLGAAGAAAASSGWYLRRVRAR